MTAEQFVGNVGRVSSADAAAKQLILRNESTVIGHVPCRVRGGGPRPQKVSFSSILIARSLTWPGRLLMVFCILRAGLFPSATRSPWFAFVTMLVKLWFIYSSIAFFPSPPFPGLNH